MKNEELLTTGSGGVDLVTTNTPDSVLHPLVANINIIYLTIINLTCDDRTSEMAPSKLDMTELRLVVVMARHPSLDCAKESCPLFISVTRNQILTPQGFQFLSLSNSHEKQ